MTARLVVVPAEVSDSPAPTASGALPRLMTVEQAARELSISSRFLRDLIKRGRVPAIRLGRAVRIARDVVERVALEGLSWTP